MDAKSGAAAAAVPARVMPDVSDALHAIRWIEDMKQHTPDVSAATTALRHATASNTATAATAAAGASIVGAPKRSLWNWLTGSGSGTTPFAPVMRVNQLDAELLDNELTGMLSYQLSRIGSQLLSPLVWAAFKPEADAFLHALIYAFTIYRDTASPGNKLSNLRYANAHAINSGDSTAARIPPLAATSALVTAATAATGAAPGAVASAAAAATDVLTRRQKLLYALIWIGGRYGWTRLNQFMLTAGWGYYPSGDWHERVARWCRHAEAVYRAASIANFIVFLWNGQYRSVLDRLLRMRLVYAHGKVVRQVSFDFMNQQLIWHGFSEFMLFILPLINFDRIRALLRRVFQAAPVDANAAGADGAAVIDTCPVCSTSPIAIPYRAQPCGHLYCYYCLAGSRTADRHFRCTRCAAAVTTIAPVQYE